MKIIAEHQEFTLCSDPKLKLCFLLENGKEFMRACLDSEEEMEVIKRNYNELVNYGRKSK